MFRTIFLAATLLLGVTSVGAMPVPVFPPGMRIGLTPVVDLAVSRRFPGFEDLDHHVTVSILDLPGAAYDGLMRSARAETQPDMADVKRENFTFAGGIGLLVEGSAKDNGTAVHRWFLIASAAPTAVPSLTAMIRVEVPETVRTVYTDALVRQMLSSVSFRQVPMQELLGLLPFKLTALADFEVKKVSPEGVVVADSSSEAPAKRAYAIITVGRGAPDLSADRARFARDMLAATPLRDLKVTSAEPMRITGSPGNEIRAEASDLGGEPVALVQWVRFGNASGVFLRIVAVSRKQSFTAVFNRFRALRDGVAFK